MVQETTRRYGIHTYSSGPFHWKFGHPAYDNFLFSTTQFGIETDTAEETIGW